MAEIIQETKRASRSFSKKWLSLLGGLSLIAILISILFLDQALTETVTTKKHVSFYRLVRTLTDLGEGKFYFAGVILTGIFSWIGSLSTKSKSTSWGRNLEKLKRWSFYAFTCMLASGVVLQVLKHLIGRQRPHVSGDVNPHVFDFITFKWHYHSMPSGHTQTLFTFATLLWITFPKLGKWIFIIPATLAFTRLPLEEHFLSDVIFGAFIGFAIPVLISARWGRIEFQSSPEK